MSTDGHEVIYETISTLLYAKNIWINVGWGVEVEAFSRRHRSSSHFIGLRNTFEMIQQKMWDIQSKVSLDLPYFEVVPSIVEINN